MFGEKKSWEYVQCILTSKLYPDFFALFCYGQKQILFYNSSAELAFNCLKSPTETQAEFVKSVES